MLPYEIPRDTEIGIAVLSLRHGEFYSFDSLDRLLPLVHRQGTGDTQLRADDAHQVLFIAGQVHALGQAKQEELLEYLFKKCDDPDQLKNLFINLSPYYKTQTNDENTDAANIPLSE